MKKILISLLSFLFCVVIFSAAVAQEPGEPREFEMKEGDTTYVMKRYYMGFLLRGNLGDEFSKSELAHIQKLHLNHLDSLAGTGKLVIAGPFGDDTEKRGVLIFDVETQVEAESLAKMDPAVKAGRLKVEIHPWWAAKGSKLP